MKIELKKIIRPLSLAEYAPEYVNESGEPVTLWCWVNPPRALTEARISRSQEGEALLAELKSLNAAEAGQSARAGEILKELAAIGQEAVEWLSVILSQGPAETQMSSEELAALAEESQENDPQLYPWILRSAWQMITEYRMTKKKA
jgi:small-conductance mechanosensitive channel